MRSMAELRQLAAGRAKARKLARALEAHPLGDDEEFPKRAERNRTGAF
jgi:hypothetical protein